MHVTVVVVVVEEMEEMAALDKHQQPVPVLRSIMALVLATQQHQQAVQQLHVQLLVHHVAQEATNLSFF